MGQQERAFHQHSLERPGLGSLPAHKGHLQPQKIAFQEGLCLESAVDFTAAIVGRAAWRQLEVTDAKSWMFSDGKGNVTDISAAQLPQGEPGRLSLKGL